MWVSSPLSCTCGLLPDVCVLSDNVLNIFLHEAFPWLFGHFHKTEIPGITITVFNMSFVEWISVLNEYWIRGSKHCYSSLCRFKSIFWEITFKTFLGYMPTWHRIISMICLQRNFACIFTFGELLLHMVFSVDIGVLLFPYWFLQIL